MNILSFNSFKKNNHPAHIQHKKYNKLEKTSLKRHLATISNTFINPGAIFLTI